MKLLVALVAVALVPMSMGVVAVQETAQFEAMQVEKNLMVPMRDGVKMATDIYRPADERQAG